MKTGIASTSLGIVLALGIGMSLSERPASSQTWTPRPSLILGAPTESAKLDVSDMFGVLTIVNRGSPITIVDVTINDRAECIFSTPELSAKDKGEALTALIFLGAINQQGFSGLFANDPQMKGALKQAELIRNLGDKKLWAKNTTLKMGEVVPAANMCDGEIVHVKIDTDRGTWRNYATDTFILQREALVAEEKKRLEAIALEQQKKRDEEQEKTAQKARQKEWRDQVVWNFQGFMRYPEGTLEDGTSTVAFTIDREGNILNSSIAHSSGSSVLDNAALDIITRTQMPRPPKSVPDDGLSFTVPLRFDGTKARAKAKEQQESRERQIVNQRLFKEQEREQQRLLEERREQQRLAEERGRITKHDQVNPRLQRFFGGRF
jgi:TonB family protein